MGSVDLVLKDDPKEEEDQGGIVISCNIVSCLEYISCSAISLAQKRSYQGPGSPISNNGAANDVGNMIYGHSLWVS